MHAVTLRRLIVFGVCAVGVSCLYLLPSVARSPHPVPGPQALDEPTTRPSDPTVRDASGPVATSAGASPSRSATAPTIQTAEQAHQPNHAEPASARRSSNGATAFDRAERTDEESPATVADLTSAEVTPTRLSLRWPAASDNIGVVGYTVQLDGFEVATTSTTSTTIRWFNDDAREHLVQVRALDAAGNLSARSANLLVARPTPAPGPMPEPSTPAPEPTPAPTATPGPTPAPSPSGSAPARGVQKVDGRSRPPERREPADAAGSQATAPAEVR